MMISSRKGYCGLARPVFLSTLPSMMLVTLVYLSRWLMYFTLLSKAMIKFILSLTSSITLKFYVYCYLSLFFISKFTFWFFWGRLGSNIHIYIEFFILLKIIFLFIIYWLKHSIFCKDYLFKDILYIFAGIIFSSNVSQITKLFNLLLFRISNFNISIWSYLIIS